MSDKPDLTKKSPYRRPEDDEWDGGNPYAEGSSITPRKDFDFARIPGKQWIAIICAGLAFAGARWFMNGGHF